MDIGKAIAPNKMATEEGKQIQMLVSRCSTVQRTPVATTPLVEKRRHPIRRYRYQGDQTMMTRYTYEVIMYTSDCKEAFASHWASRSLILF